MGGRWRLLTQTPLIACWTLWWCLFALCWNLWFTLNPRALPNSLCTRQLHRLDLGFGGTGVFASFRASLAVYYRSTHYSVRKTANSSRPLLLLTHHIRFEREN